MSLADQRTIDIYDQRADDYATRFESKEPPSALKQFMEHLPERGYVLDWGCGPGTASFHMREAGFAPEPVDASEGMSKIASKKYGLSVRIGNFDDVLPEQKYCGVWANFSLLHAHRSAMLGYLKKLQRSLLPEGILHLGMKTGTGEKRDKLGRYYTFYETRELKNMLMSAGFDVLNVHEGQEAGLAGSIDPFVLILSQKKLVKS